MPIKKKLNVILKGMLMGAADVVPGVSGGTIAFITGIYEELIKTIDRLDISIFKKVINRPLRETAISYNLGFLLCLLTGIAISVLSLAKIITHLLENYTVLVWAFFFGLVLASIWYIGKQVSQWNIAAIITLILGATISYFVTIAEPLGAPDSWWYLIFSGFIAIIAMILPGISGAFLLLLLGSYQTVLGSITGMVEGTVAGDWPIVVKSFGNIILVAIGAIIGLKLFSRALTWLFENQKNITLALLTGFMIGSLNKLWPWKETLSTRLNSKGLEVPFLEKSILPANYSGDPQLLWVSILVLAGFLLILIMERWAIKKQS